MKYLFITFLGIYLLTGSVLAAEFTLPAGNPITKTTIENLILSIYTFLVWASVIVAMGTLIVAGLMWATAGNSGRVEQAKAMLKGGIIGAAIILGSGVIIRTVSVFVTSQGESGSGGFSSGGVGATCRGDRDCRAGLICDFRFTGPTRGTCERR